MKTEAQNESHRKASKKYKKTEKGKETIRKFLEKYKNKNRSRHYTNDIIKGRRHYKPLDLPASFFRCKVCGEIERLELHHEVYPKAKKDIVKAIEDELIFMLCNRHHNELHLNNKSNVDIPNTNSQHTCLGENKDLSLDEGSIPSADTLSKNKKEVKKDE